MSLYLDSAYTPFQDNSVVAASVSNGASTICPDCGQVVYKILGYKTYFDKTQKGGYIDHKCVSKTPIGEISASVVILTLIITCIHHYFKYGRRIKK